MSTDQVWEPAGEVQIEVKAVPHCLPVGDELPHRASGRCWCQPLAQPVMGFNGPCGHQWIHHAKDCRERFERQGLPGGLGWQIVVGEEVVRVLLPAEPTWRVRLKRRLRAWLLGLDFRRGM